MKLTIRRNQSQKTGLFGGNKGALFELYGKCSVGESERALIAKYKVENYELATYKLVEQGEEAIERYITVNDLLNGQTITTKSIGTLLNLEEKMKDGCGNLKALLTVMATFGGEESFEI